MKVFLFDSDHIGLAFALRCLDAGHDVRVWQPVLPGTGKPSLVGDGMVTKVKDWEPSMKWADLIVMTDNTKYAGPLRPYFNSGFPILGTNEESAELELDRMEGQKVLEQNGIETLPYEVFSNYDKAISFVKSEKKEYVSKPWGGTSDKNLSYVPGTKADLINRLARWKVEGLKGDFILQEKIDGLEMGVASWFGPGGFGTAIEENFEFKKMLVGNLGPTTGEMGTILRYTKKSKLFEEVLAPLEEELLARKFVGSASVNCMVDKKGKPWPLEFTMRMGWPAFNLAMALHKGDPAAWMLDLINGKDSLKVDYKVCCGVVMTMGDFPWDRDPPGRNDGWPIRGLGPKTLPQCALTNVMKGKGWVDQGTKVLETESIVTAGSYVLVVTGVGDTVQEAKADCMEVVEEIKWAPHQTYRVDIGDRLEEHLPILHEHGFAAGLEY